MTTAIERITAPAARPVEVSDAMFHLRLSDEFDIAQVERLLDAAVSMIDGEGDLGRAMITQTWAQWERQEPGHVVLTMGPFQALTSVEYYDADGTLQTATLGDFETRKHGDYVICKPKEGKTWPPADVRDDAIKITYTAGYGDAPEDVPAALRHALLMLVAHFYENREPVTERKLQTLPLAVDHLIGNYRVAYYGG